MRKLGRPVQNVLHATVNLGAHVETGTNNTESMKKGMLAKIWNERDVQIMVVISLALQLFLLFAGNVRRRRRVGWLRSLVWLAYLSSYTVAASAIGLFSQYEDKYKLRSAESSSEHLHTMMMPFLWAPFLLLHLGGPDTITAFSIEDNNLWTRQLINLAFQLSLALYVFWKSFDLLDTQLLVVAVPIFIAGIIKYGERIWVLKNCSRDGLDSPVAMPPIGDSLESYALRSAFVSRGLLTGRKILHLSLSDSSAYLDTPRMPIDMLEFVLMELGMIYDMLYTKTMVLRSCTGIVFRGIALVAMMVGFVLFWVNQHLHTHRTTNAAITYMLFLAAICVELYSIFLAIASPWTRVRFKALLCLSRKLACCFPCQGLPNPSMGQFNPVLYSLSMKSRPKLISKVLEALGMEKHWRIFWYVDHVEDKVMVEYIVGLFNFEHTHPSGERSHKLEFGEVLQDLLDLPFEHLIFRLHIFTERHLGTLADGSSSKMKVLAAQCRVLSNYLMYLMEVCPSMLAVNRGAAQDLLFSFSGWDNKDIGDRSPFRADATVQSLEDMKELWARLLIYASGKCLMEQHARQLGNGPELLTVVGSLLSHLSIGDAGTRELKLLATPGYTPPYILVGLPAGTLQTRKSDFLYAFEFYEQAPDHQVLQQPPAQSTQHTRLCVKAWAGDKPRKKAESPSQPVVLCFRPAETSRGNELQQTHNTLGL
uniref:Uncharacterized protein n=1 Tax=Avena sativa TaxID=4498 RepID=A0ACD5WPE5_AVESA